MSRTRSKCKCSPFSVVRYTRSRLMVVLLVVICLVSFMLIYQGTLLHGPSTGKIRLRTTTTTTTTTILYKESRKNNVACSLPLLNPFHPSVLHFIEDLGKLRCKGASYSSFENNVLHVEGKDLVSARYRKIERPTGNDFDAVLSDPVNVPNVSEGNKGESFSRI